MSKKTKSIVIEYAKNGRLRIYLETFDLSKRTVMLDYPTKSYLLGTYVSEEIGNIKDLHDRKKMIQVVCEALGVSTIIREEMKLENYKNNDV